MTIADNITIEENADWASGFPPYRVSGVAVDLSGWTAQTMVRVDKEDASPVLLLQTGGQGIVLGTGGSVSVSITHVQASALVPLLPELKGFYDVLLISPSGNHVRFVEGTVSLSLAVTRGAELPPQPALLVADWYVDWISGDDGNDGSATSPVKTIMGGVVPKWGTPDPRLPQGTTIHVLSSQPRGAEKILINPTMIGASTFSIDCTKTLAKSFSLGTVTPLAYGASGTGTLLQSTGFTGCSRGQVVINTTPGKESEAFIKSVSGDTATLSQPVQTVTRGVFAPEFVNRNLVSVTTWAHSDTVEVFDLCGLNLIDVNLVGNETTAATTVGGIGWIENAKIYDPCGVFGTNIFTPQYDGGNVVLNRCWVESYLQTSETAALTTLYNVFAEGGGQIESTQVFGGVSGLYALQARHINWIDGNHICEGGVFATAGVLYCGLLYISAGASLFTHPGAQAEIRQILGTVVGIVWGPGVCTAQPFSGVTRRQPTASWAACLKLASLHFPSAMTTGTAYASGVWTDGISLTSANLDTYHGLIDPRTGARFCEDL